AILYPSLSMGAKGAILAVAGVAPRACVELYDAVQEGNHTKARDLQNRLAPLSNIVTAGLGVTGLKAALEMAGYSGGSPCAPLLAASETEHDKVKTVMRNTGLFPDFE